VFEKGSVDAIFYQTEHPYTQALLRSTPRLDSLDEVLPSIPGTTPDLARIGEGCPFFERCSYRKELCQISFPAVTRKQEGHERYCHVEGLTP
jgi:oligopeptide transport system ATP-binding protein